MKLSTSTNSLSALDEKGCIFCNEAEGETGESLVESRTLTQCKCSFRVHRTCWDTRVVSSDDKLCPSCNKTVIPAFMIYPAISNDRGNGRGNMSYHNWHMIYITLFIIVVGIFIIVGIELNWFKKVN